LEESRWAGKARKARKLAIEEETIEEEAIKEEAIAVGIRPAVETTPCSIKAARCESVGSACE
jgi:hypothetical protein